LFRISTSDKQICFFSTLGNVYVYEGNYLVVTSRLLLAERMIRSINPIQTTVHLSRKNLFRKISQLVHDGAQNIRQKM